MSVPNRVALSIGGFHIYWYGVLIALAVLLSVAYCAWQMKKKNYPEDAIYNIALWCIPLAIVFARAYYVLFSFNYYKDNLLSVFYVWEGGLAVYGSIIGGALGVLLCCKVHKYHFLDVADTIVPALAFAQGIGRWGNFFNQEAYGAAVTNPSLQFFPYAVYIENPLNGSSIHWYQATFFYESAACVLIALILHFIVRKKVKQEGSVFLSYLVLYGIERAIVESMRSDSLYLGNLRVSQVLSVLLVVVGAALLIMRWYNNRVDAQVEADPSLSLGIDPKALDVDEEETEDEETEDAEDSVEEAIEEAAEDSIEETVEDAAEEGIENIEEAVKETEDKE